MVVNPGPNPSGMQAKPLQMVAGGLLKAPGHIEHVSGWCQLFNVQPLTILAFIHGPDELVSIIVPLLVIERGDLAGIKTPHHMDIGEGAPLAGKPGGGPAVGNTPLMEVLEVVIVEDAMEA